MPRLDILPLEKLAGKSDSIPFGLNADYSVSRGSPVTSSSCRERGASVRRHYRNLALVLREEAVNYRKKTGITNN